MKTAVVTGANGFVGRAVTKELAESGVSVYAVVREGALRTADLSGDANVTVIHCDLGDYDRLPELIPANGIDVFYHFAWEGSAGPKRGDDSCQINNIRWSCGAVNAAKALGCGRFVFAGSIMEYEIEAQMRTESAPSVVTLYCTAKKAADYMCRALANACGMEYVCGLISNIYGPGEHSPRLINTSIRKLLMGEHAAFSAGEQMYDFVYIADAARAFAAIGEKGKNNKIYYIGSAEPRPLKEFLLKLRDTTAPDMEIGLGELPFHGVGLRYDEFDVTAVQRDTGVSPLVSFEEGVSRTVEWIKQEGIGE